MPPSIAGTVQERRATVPSQLSIGVDRDVRDVRVLSWAASAFSTTETAPRLPKQGGVTQPAQPANGVVPLDAAPQLGITCMGVLDVGNHFEYVFNVKHPCGCSWQVQRRYSELLELHAELSQRFGGLPPFPPQRSLGQRLTTSEWDAANQRVIALQRYMQLLAFRTDVLRPRYVLATLGAEAPEAVVGLRVLRWDFQSPQGWSCRDGNCEVAAQVEFEVASIMAEGCCKPVEGFEVRIRSGGGSSRSVADGAVITSSFGEPTWTPRLPCGTEVELEVRTWNAVGASSPAVVRIYVPPPDVAEEPEGHPVFIPATIAPPIASAGSPFAGRSRVAVGSRVKAVWAGDGNWYDAIVRHLDGHGREAEATVDWLRPAPLATEELRCVCAAGGDDTLHRRIPIQKVQLTSVWRREHGQCGGTDVSTVVGVACAGPNGGCLGGGAGKPEPQPRLRPSPGSTLGPRPAPAAAPSAACSSPSRRPVSPTNSAETTPDPHHQAALSGRPVLPERAMRQLPTPIPSPLSSPLMAPRSGSRDGGARRNVSVGDDGSRGEPESPTMPPPSAPLSPSGRLLRPETGKARRPMSVRNESPTVPPPSAPMSPSRRLRHSETGLADIAAAASHISDAEPQPRRMSARRSQHLPLEPEYTPPLAVVGSSSATPSLESSPRLLLADEMFREEEFLAETVPRLFHDEYPPAHVPAERSLASKGSSGAYPPRPVNRVAF